MLDLATELLGDDGGEWTPEKIEETLASKKSKQANFVKPVPVHIVYFSVAALTDGSIVNYTDLYKRDEQGDRGAARRRRQGAGQSRTKKVATN